MKLNKLIDSRALTGLVLAVALAVPLAAGAFILSDPTSPVFYNYAIVGGDDVSIDRDVTVVGNVHSNDDVKAKSRSTIDGDVSAVDDAKVDGAVTGTVTAGAAPLAIPPLPSASEARDLADRVFEGDTTFDEDQVVDDVVFVDGKVRFAAGLNGSGTVIASGDVRIDSDGDSDSDSDSDGDSDGDSDSDGGSGPPPPPILDDGTYLSIISLRDIRLEKERALRGVLQAARKIDLKKDCSFEGVLVAGDKVKVDKGCQVAFLSPDDEPPVISGLTPPDGSLLTEPVSRIAASFADDLSGVDVGSFQLVVDGVDRTAEAEADETGFELLLANPLADGLHTVEVALADRAGNQAVVAWQFTVQLTAAPTLAINRPADGETFFDPGSQTIAGSFEGEAGLDLSSLMVALDGSPVDVASDCQVGADFFRCELPSPPEGPHTASASIMDLVGRTAQDAVAFDIVVDSQPPTLAIVAPEPVLLNNPTPPIELEYSDSGSGIDIGSLSVALDGVDLTAVCGEGETAASCAVEPIAAGAHLVTAEIRDNVGNVATASLAFEIVVDDAPAVVVVDTPVAGATVNQATVTVSGTASDPNGVESVQVNRIEALFDGFAFTAEVPLDPGLNAIAVETLDGAGNVGFVRVEVTYVVDDAAPELAILAPAAGSFVTDPRPGVRLELADDNGIDEASLALSVNGAPASASCLFGFGEAECALDDPLPAGAVTLGASLADLFGNTATAAAAFVVDPVPLEVAITDPLNGLVTGDGELIVSGTTSAGVAAVEVNGVPAALGGGSFSATVPLREGTQMIVAAATRANGNSTSDSIEVTRDIEPPIVRIESPRAGQQLANPVTSVTGLVNDIVNAGLSPTVFVNGIAAEVTIGTFFVPELVLIPGANTIEVVASDAVGNEGRDSIDVRFTPPVGPKIRLESGNGQTAAVGEQLAEPLVVVVDDAFGLPAPGKIVRFEVSRNSALLRLAPGDPPTRRLEVPTDITGRAQVLLTLGDTNGAGNNRVLATALGVAGEVEFCASAVAAPAAQVLMTSGDNQRGAVGRPLAEPFEALVVDARGNQVPGVEVTFTVERGGGQLDGQPSRIVTTGGDGVARAVLKLGPAAGINNNVVIASIDGTTLSPASFTASGLAPGDPAQTRFSGVVLDNSQLPIPGATVTIDGTALVAVTDANGQFELTGVPVGRIHLDIDASTTPRPEPFPHLAFETVTVAGQDNNLGQPILLPVIDLPNAAVVGGSEDTTLIMEGVDGLLLTVFANSVTFPDGSPVGPISISQVQLDKVPMAPPNGSFFMPPAWSIQPAGVAFDPPARIEIPNDGLAPGRVIDIFQFDHTLNEFINVGRGTVTDDGRSIISDPGFGITRAGWGGCGQPPPPETCANGCNDGNQCTSGQCFGSTCVQRVLDGNSCDDGKFCTQNDRCNQSSCQGDPKPDGPSTVSQFAANLDAFDPVKNILRRLLGPQAPDFTFNLSGSVSKKSVCCEVKMMNVENPTASVSGSVGVRGEALIPGTGFMLPFGLGQAGVKASVALTLTGAGSLQVDDCTENHQGTVTVQITLSGGIALVFDLPANVIKFKAGGTVSASGGGTADLISKNELQFEGFVQFDGVTLSITVELINGLVEESFSIVFLQGEATPLPPVIVPINL